MAVLLRALRALIPTHGSMRFIFGMSIQARNCVRYE